MADGLRRMYVEGEDIFYYLSLYNENYAMPPMPAGVEDGILKGLYKFKPGPEGKKLKAHIFGSGPIIDSALESPGNSGGTVRCFRRCLERNQLQAAPHRCDSLPALEHAAPDATAEEILR